MRATETTTNTGRFVVRRYRQGEAAPSLSLSYPGVTEHEALMAHFERYGVPCVDYFYEVCEPGQRWGKRFDYRGIPA